MVKRRDKIALGTLIVGLVLVLIFLAMLALTAHQRDAALAKFSPPEGLDVYQELAAEPADADEAHAPLRHKVQSFQQVFDTMPLNREWQDLDRQRDHPEERTDDYWPRWEELMNSFQPYLEDVRRTASQGGPVAQLDLSHGLDIDLRHLSFMRLIVEILAMDTRAAARQEDENRVVDDVIAMMQFGDAVAGEPILASQHTRLGIYEMAGQVMAEALPLGLSADNMQRLIAHMAAADHRDEFAEGFAGEVLLNKSIVDHPERLVEKREDWAEYLVFNDPMNILYNTPLGAPFLNADATSYFELGGRMEDAARLPYHQALPELGAIQYEIHSLPRTRILSRGVLPALPGTIEAQAHHEARLDLAQLGIALERYYATFHEYPQTLDAIAGDLPDGVPVDVFTGRPYIYRPAEDSFLLYSAGRNQSDDGGAALRHPDQADIVWRGAERENPR